MFTGIIETTGKVEKILSHDDSTRLVIESDLIAKNITIGESISINGCCLTVVEANGSSLHFDLLSETLFRTNLKNIKSGHLVNLERALKADGRLGGHFVSGHIDDVRKILRFEKQGNDYLLEVEINPLHAKWIVDKGSITVDGISLTVAKVSSESFQVWIIPHTREVTCLKDRRAGDEVNLEFDLLAKYVEKILATKETLRYS